MGREIVSARDFEERVFSDRRIPPHNFLAVFEMVTSCQQKCPPSRQKQIIMSYSANHIHVQLDSLVHYAHFKALLGVIQNKCHFVFLKCLQMSPSVYKYRLSTCLVWPTTSWTPSPPLPNVANQNVATSSAPRTVTASKIATSAYCHLKCRHLRMSPPQMAPTRMPLPQNAAPQSAHT